MDLANTRDAGLMACERTREVLPMFARGGLEPVQRADVLRHLASCGECRTELAALVALRQVVRRDAAIPPAIAARAFAKLPPHEPAAEAARTPPSAAEMLVEALCRDNVQFALRLVLPYTRPAAETLRLVNNLTNGGIGYGER